MLRCNQVSRLVAGDDLADGRVWLQLRVRLHLMMCRHCARYAAQIRALGAKARERFARIDEQPDVEELQRRILDSAARSGAERDPS